VFYQDVDSENKFKLKKAAKHSAKKSKSSKEWFIKFFKEFENGFKAEVFNELKPFL
jgi:hypothetical protein